MQPDDYYSNGLIEIARFGKHTMLKNNMSEKQHKRTIQKLSRKYPKLKRKIDKLVRSIRKQVSKCDPIQLLTYSSDMFLMSNIGISSEIQASREKIYISRMTEYIQSIIASSKIKYKTTKKDPSFHYFRIQKNIMKLYKQIDDFYYCWFALAEQLYTKYDKEIIENVLESQLLYSVRGKRYPVFEVEYYEKLLKNHNDIFLKLFNISYVQIIEGIKKLQYALSQEKFDIYEEFGEKLDAFLECGETDFNKFRESNPDAGTSFVEKFLGSKLHNVIYITGWPEKFVNILSWEINQCTDFYNNRDFSGWPIIDLPIQKRPFLKINNDYYCFDYYSFVDNFYRAIQKAISREAPEYNWNYNQKESSESMVADVFSNILPGCTIYRDNYYPKNKSLKNLAENDIIIVYENVLIIVEVKAGSFIYTAPIEDFENHIVSYKNLIEVADHQCKRTYDYLVSNPMAVIYNQNTSIKTQIDMNNINDIFMISVTVDNINDFAAHAEKLNFLQLKCNAISISIDDLMVYREYFDSPLVFLHFLKQRRQATLEDKLALNDELDHLGMYIEHNMYCLQLKDYPSDTKIIFQGYREDLDEYFSTLYHPHLKHKKPKQQHPLLFSKIINYLDNNVVDNKVLASNYLLNFSSDAKDEFCKKIEYILNRQKELGYMIAFNTAGSDEDSLRYTAFIEQPNIDVFTNKYMQEYVLSTILWNSDKNRVMLNLKFDNSNELIDFSFKEYSPLDIKECDREFLLHQGKIRAIQKIKIHLEKYGQLKNDEICPCGSGKVYGECCNRFFQ
ncbi:MAG: SEC-C domain-containing protein [Candidatus Gastranaerophilales bacterium]|nr:SEC-C domain-containing protein [Candidatus Gastranaerophilales bacterium]